MRIHAFLFLVTFVFFGNAYSQNRNSKEAGIEAFELEKWQESVQNLDKWLQINPRDPEAYWIRGQAWERLGELEKAHVDLSTLLELDPENAEALFERGRLRYQLKLFEGALDDFEDFLLLPPGETNRVLFKIAPGDSGVSGITTVQSFAPDEAYYHMGLCAIELKNYELAISYLDLATEENPSNPDYYSERGKALARLGENMAAIESYEIALDLDPSHKPARQGLAQVRNGGDEFLLAELNTLIDSGEANSQTFKQRGFYRMSHEDLNGALEDFSKAIQKDSNDPENFFYLAWAYSRQKNWKKAEENYTQAIELEPTNPEYFLARGQSRFQNGQTEGALADFTLATSIDPDHASGHYHKGIAFQKLGKKELACEEFKRGMELGMEASKKAFEKACGKN
ncbi:tetratricopeptide repeat protein [Algoriphagus mannitolivorans]|uniref:tetratricopeptide repeat protein n=1 Tax=Algoriphagus mannitolivorans TaxID=226504 RepID=UPI00041682E9|nr:tetratricopeptide repeat protein [Algoriphagus mannitolivorans]